MAKMAPMLYTIGKQGMTDVALWYSGEQVFSWIFRGGKWAWELYRVQGLSSEAIGAALTDMNAGGGHAIRYLMKEGLISNSGSLASRIEAFSNIAARILDKPIATYDKILRGGANVIGYEGYYAGRRVTIYIGKTGQFAGKVVTATVK